MEPKNWTMVKGNGKNAGLMMLGKRPEHLPEHSFISLTRGEGLNVFQLLINQLLTIFVMMQMKNSPGLLYAEVSGELEGWKGSGQTLTVWQGKNMPNFRNKKSHGFSMKFFKWVIHRANTETYYLTYKSNGHIPSTLEAANLLKEYGKYYEGGKLARAAQPPGNELVH